MGEVTKIADIGKNAVEDGVEDFISAFLFRKMKSLTEPFKKDFNSDSDFDNAMNSFIDTLAMGLQMYAYSKIMNFFFERSAKIGVALWVYISAGTFKKALLNKLKNSNFKGKKLLRTVSTVLGADKTSERIQVAQIMRDNVNSFDAHKFHYQNQHQKGEDRLYKMSGSATNLKNANENSILTRFTQKSLTGTWANTNQDKKLYEKATGITVVESGSGAWSSLYEQLNKYNEFAKTVDGEITNLATALQMVLSKSGLVR